MSTEIGYCDKSPVKDRLLIASSDTSYDSSLELAICDASRLVDIFLKPYTTVPLAEENINAQINNITADFAASIFKRRMVPNEVTLKGSMLPSSVDIMSEMDASGWFAIGIRKLELYIKSYYTLAEVIGNTLHNPDMWLNLVKQGIITVKEARAGISGATSTVLTEIEDITKKVSATTAETITKAETLTLNKTDTITEALTRSEGIIRDTSGTTSEIISRGETRTFDISGITGETITKDETLTKGETLTTDETVTKKVSGETSETISKDETIQEYKTKKQKSFAFIESDKNGKYKEQE